MGFLDRFTGGRAKHLRAALLWLEPVGGGVLDRTVRHVRTGSDVDVLADIAAAARAGTLRPRVNRNALGPLLTSNEIDAAGLLRLTHVWAAAGALSSRPTTAGASPVDQAADLLEGVVELLRASGARAVEAGLLVTVLEAAGHSREVATAGALTFDVRHSALPSYRRLTVDHSADLTLAAPAQLHELLGAGAADLRAGALDRLTLAPAAVPTHVHRVVDLTRDTSKRVREAALNTLDQLPPEQRRTALARAHEEAPPAIARTIAPRLGQATSIAASGPGGAADAESDPVPPPWEPLAATPVGPDVIEHLEAAIARQRAQNELVLERSPGLTWVVASSRMLAGLTRPVLADLIEELGREGPVRVGLLDRGSGHLLINALGAAPGVTLRHLIRLACLAQNRYPFHAAAQHRPIDVDLRAVAAAVEEAVGDNRAEHELTVAEQIVARVLTSWHPVPIAPEHRWPYFAERPELLEVGLGLRPAPSSRNRSTPDTGATLDLLADFPRTPQRFVARLTELALGDGRLHRVQAQDLLSRQGGFAIAADGLTSSTAAIRATAARWLARIVAVAPENERDDVRERAVAALSTALAKEKREVAQAAVLGSLRVLGVDLSDHLSPSALGSQAAVGLKKKLPAGMDWVPLDQLPPVRWADGSDVDPAVVRWWAVLAVKLKDPTGEGLLPLYVSLLDPPSRRALGSFVLGVWTAHDLERMSEEDARAEAAAQAPGRLAQFQHWAQRSSADHWRAQAARPLADIEAEIARDLQGTFLGTAIKEKGLLALAAGAPGHEVTEAITRYTKRHPERRSQVEVLVVAASVNDDPAALQAVISIARSHRQRTVRERAGELVEQIAQQRGWTQEELADRTIPTAQFPSDEGVATLDLGSRTFTMRIGEDLALALFTAEGKPLKSLPKPGVKDDPELAKAARSSFTTAKKELAQVVDLQSARLQEAMALGRTWSAQTWRTAFLEHPVMRHLVARLVWATGEIDGPDGDVTLFAPTLDGELLDAEDGEVELADGARVWLTHASRLDPATAERWRDRLVDYGVTPLFDQLEAAAGEVAPSAKEIVDRQGWVMTVGALKTRAARQGFRLAAGEDGGWVSSLLKDVGPWQVVVEITGTYPGQGVGENVAVTRLLLNRGGRTATMGEAPAVLRAVAHHDYHAIADGGAFDPEWAKRTGF